MATPGASERLHPLKSESILATFLVGRDGEIRTRDPLHPMRGRNRLDQAQCLKVVA
jgi:hypothetical protein